MKLSQLKQKLLINNLNKPIDKKWTSSIRSEFSKNISLDVDFKNSINNQNNYLNHELPSILDYNKTEEVLGLEKQIENIETNVSKLDNIKIIGITGSRGKSSTAFLVHEYLKRINKKSILYSSIRIDSPASYININEPCEVPIQNESVLLDIISEAEAIDAEYIVMEINESTIKKGYINDIDFTIRALTNINPHHNEEHYSPEEYVSLKKAFLENIPDEEESICIIGLTDYLTREDFNEILKLNNKPKLTYSSKEKCVKENALYTNLDILLYDQKSTIDNQEFNLRIKDNIYKFSSSVLFSHNGFNFACAAAILEGLGLFSHEEFSKCIKDITIPGREEVIRVNNRTIIIGLHLYPVLEQLKRFQDNEEIGDIKVVVGSMGSGFVTWSEEFKNQRFLLQQSKIRKFAMDYLSLYTDHVYITSNDNADDDPLDIANELNSYINKSIPRTIIVDRKEAIKKAIEESKENDLIYISGRGNRKIFCDTKSTMKLFLDRDVVLEEIERLGW